MGGVVSLMCSADMVFLRLIDTAIIQYCDFRYFDTLITSVMRFTWASQQKVVTGLS